MPESTVMMLEKGQFHGNQKDIYSAFQLELDVTPL